MSGGNENKETAAKHSVVIEDRSRVKINCVDDVESFNEEKAVVYTSMGVMIITGYNFKVSRLNVDDGRLEIEGEIDKIEYTEAPDSRDSSGGFFGRLFR